MDNNSKAQEAVISKSVDELAACAQEWSKQDNERNKFVQMLLQRLASTEDETRRLRMDLDDQTRSRYQYQERVDHLMAKNKKYEDLFTKGPYVAVLVDGDGAKFQDSLLRDPGHGATEAAHRLKQHIVDYLKDTPLGGNVTIFARVFANVKGLAKALRQSGIINYDDDFYQFAENFTNSRAEFDFVNVGYGKENADSKIRRMLKYYFDDVRCKKIFFVACHDAGYAHDLRPYIDDPESRLVLVETTPAEQNMKNLSLPIIRFDRVFRDGLLQNEIKFTAPPSPPQRTPPLPLAHVQPPSTTSTPPSPSVTHLPMATTVRSGNGGVSTTYTGSYAAAGGTNGHKNIAVPPSKQRPAKIIELNENNVRLDPPLRIPGHTPAQDSYKRKLSEAKGQAFCNNLYLSGACKWGNDCFREHEMKLTADELVIHRYRARTSPCYSGPRCSDFYCPQSHHCPQDPHCTRGIDCRFKNHEKFGNMHLSREELKAVSSRLNLKPNSSPIPTLFPSSCKQHNVLIVLVIHDSPLKSAPLHIAVPLPRTTISMTII